MIVKFWGTKNGGGIGAINYLLNHREKEGTAITLKGDPEITKDIINGITRKHKVTVGCLSFSEGHLDSEVKVKLMEDFEKMLLPDLDSSNYNILWVEHSDKGRVELNFVIPKIDLESGKRLNSYLDKLDRDRVDTWKRIVNIENNFSSPDDPSKAQAFTHNNKNPFLKDYEELNGYLYQQVEEENITSRDGLVCFLKEANILVTRESKNYLSIKLPDAKKAKRFKGGIYSEKFKSIENVKDEYRTECERSKAYRVRNIREELRLLNLKGDRERKRKITEHNKCFNTVSKREHKDTLGRSDEVISINRDNRGTSNNDFGGGSTNSCKGDQRIGKFDIYSCNHSFSCELGPFSVVSDKVSVRRYQRQHKLNDQTTAEDISSNLQKRNTFQQKRDSVYRFNTKIGATHECPGDPVTQGVRASRNREQEAKRRDRETRQRARETRQRAREKRESIFEGIRRDQQQLQKRIERHFLKLKREFDIYAQRLHVFKEDIGKLAKKVRTRVKGSISFLLGDGDFTI
jgi:hypothetical protein